MNFNIISININSLNDHRKRTAFIDWLHCMKVDVVCLQKTHAPSHESIRWWFRNSGFHAASSCFTNKSGGTAILVKGTYKIDKIIHDDAGRFVQALVSLGDESLSFISLYAPNRNPARNTFFTSLMGLIDLTRPVFVAGDFNSVLDSALDRKRRPSFTDRKAAQKRSHKSSLLKRMQELQALFEAGDQASFVVLCAVQQELHSIALHEARGAQVRARCQWAEEGETSSSFFLNLAKQVMRSIRDPNTGAVCHDPFVIVGVWRNYYRDLFTATQCDPVAQDELLAKLTRRLDSNEQASCEGCLTVDECFQALMGMSRSKTPGSDGFPMEFYVTFWEALGADLVRVLNLAFETGQLSTSQRRGLIIVLYKKDNPLETKNWRPISLLNVDYKIATRAISGRLLGVLGSVIGPDQTCGVPGRTISENLSLIRDLLEYVDRKTTRLRCSLLIGRRLLIA